MTAQPSARGLAAAQSLVDVHDELRHELDGVRRLVGQVVTGATSATDARGDLQRLSLRSHSWRTGGFCAAHCLAVAQHHYGEDHEIFPLLRRSDPSLAPVLDRLEGDHLVIHGLLERLDLALVDLVREPEPVTTQLQQVLDEFTEVLLAHLSYEEDRLLGPMAEIFG